MSFLHDASGLIGRNVRELGVKLDGKAVTALVILDQTYHHTHGGLLNRSSELLGRIDQGTVVTSGIGTRKQQLGIGAARLDAFLQWVSQGEIEHSIG